MHPGFKKHATDLSAAERVPPSRRRTPEPAAGAGESLRAQNTFLRISRLRVKTGWETQRVGMRALDPDTTPRRTSPMVSVACRILTVPDARKGRGFTRNSAGARSGRAKTIGEPEVLSRRGIFCPGRDHPD
jgi:hypothetical protein